MPHIKLPYGSHFITLDLDWLPYPAQVLNPRTGSLPDAHAVSAALAAPLGSLPLRQLVQRGEKIAIVVSDITRPCPTHEILPPVLAELYAAGVQDEDMTIVFALGLHRRHTADEQRELVGEAIFKRLRCIDGDPNDTVYLGMTRRGTPIDVFTAVAQADFRIGIGNIEPHYFAGFSGGAKAFIPGVCSERTIRINHALMLEAGAANGVLDGNPVREDIDEAGDLLGIHFIVNVILDSQKQICGAVAGDVRRAHRQGCSLVYANTTHIHEPVDAAIVSAGGYPKDLNFYQGQKVLDKVAPLVKNGGKILLVAECSEGFGHTVFEEWLTGYSVDEAYKRLKTNFQLGGHKAYAISKVLATTDILMVSHIPVSRLAMSGIRAYDNFGDALIQLINHLPPNPAILIIPNTGSSLLDVRAR